MNWKRFTLFSVLLLVGTILGGTGIASGCTLVGATGPRAAGDTFFGQTMDNPWWNTRHTLWVIQPENGYKYIGTKAYVWGFWTGLNEKGFGWAGSYIDSKDQPDPAGIDRFEIGPLLLANAATVDEAIAILKKTPRSKDFPTRNAIMADAKGNLALVEIAFASLNVHLLTQNGYIVAANHALSDVIKDFGREDWTGTSHLRLDRGNKWFDEIKGKVPVHLEDMFDFYSYVYMPLQKDPVFGPGTGGLMQPLKLTYWFTYGWPGGNLPTPELEKRQVNQNMSWGVWIPFYLPELPAGQYTTELGQLTPLAMQYLYSHFTSELQRSPAWHRYQSKDPLMPYYKPEADMASPSGYTPKENPYGPGGMLGTWTEEKGFVPLEIKK